MVLIQALTFSNTDFPSFDEVMHVLIACVGDKKQELSHIQQSAFTRQEDNYMRSKPFRVFSAPTTLSKYGRPEIDCLQTGLNDEPIEPSQLSVEAIRWIIRRYAKEGVVTWFDGTGTCSVAALIEGKHAVGIEPNKIRHEAASRRIHEFKHRAFLGIQQERGETSAGKNACHLHK
jgi:DNA modification methylase